MKQVFLTNRSSARNPRRGRFHCARKTGSLYILVSDCATKNVAVSDLGIKEMGNRIPDEVNKDLGNEERIEIMFSKDWLYKFKRRYNNWYNNMDGKRASAKSATTFELLLALKQNLWKFTIQDIYNADDLCLQYFIAPDSTVSTQNRSEKINKKHKLPFLTALTQPELRSISCGSLEDQTNHEQSKNHLRLSLSSTADGIERSRWRERCYRNGWWVSITMWEFGVNMSFCWSAIAQPMQKHDSEELSISNTCFLFPPPNPKLIHIIYGCRGDNNRNRYSYAMKQA